MGIKTMQETITELANEYAPVNGNWYVDVHESEIEVGMDTLSCISNFVDELEEKGIHYGVVDDGNKGWVAYVYV